MADVRQEALPQAAQAAGEPAQSLVSRLVNATPGALGVAAVAAQQLLKRKADLISSPSLPSHLQIATHGSSSSQASPCYPVTAVLCCKDVSATPAFSCSSP